METSFLEQESEKPLRTQWHRSLGLLLVESFTGSNYDVELEKELSYIRQMVDILIIRKRIGRSLLQVPNGLENLAEYNLLTFKSHQESLSKWSIEELIGHYVNYRKRELGDVDKEMHPENLFRLYAVCAHYPRKLFDGLFVTAVSSAVFDIVYGQTDVRVIVLSQVPQTPNNAIWCLFSGIVERVQYGRDSYQWKNLDFSEVINDIFKYYQIEGLPMSYTKEDYFREKREEMLATITVDDVLKRIPVDDVLKRIPVDDILEKIPSDEVMKRLSPEDRLKGLLPEDRLKGLLPEDRLKGLLPEDRLKGLSTEDLVKRLSLEDRMKGLSSEDLVKRFSLEDRLKGLSTKDIEDYLNRIRNSKEIP